MKKSKKDLLENTYQQFMKVCFNELDPARVKDIADKSIMGFGTTFDEKVFSLNKLEEFLKLQQVQSEGMQMTWNTSPLNRHISDDENSAVYADDVFLHIQTDAETIEMYLRVSVVLEYKNDKWLVVHWHASKPEEVESEKDTFGIDTWKEKAEALEKIVQERTADLAIKNRELEIETSLEKVRTVAMGMRQADDLLNICEVMFHELKKLGFDDLRNAMTNIYYDDKAYLLNYDYSNSTGKTVSTFKYNSHPIVDNLIHHAKHSRDHFTEMIYAGKDLDDWRKFRKENGEADDARLDSVDALHYYFYSTGTGAIGISLFTAANEEQLNVLKRFRNVFDLAYKRYVDITTAEAQTRESQIELALERVRARTMAMQHSNELAETSSILFQQIKELGFETWSCGFCIWKENDLTEVWMGADSGGLLPPMYIPYKEEPTHHEVYKAHLNDVHSYHKIWEGKSLEKHYAFLKTISSVKEAIDLLERSGLSLPERQCYYVGFFKEGYLLLITKDPNDELKDLSSRFAKIFDQTYTRFLDLQKAEKQTRTAQIELAVERVRAKALAMHSSTQILDVVSTLRDEMLGLEIPGVVASTIYLQEEDDYIRMWDLSSVIIMEDGFHVALDVKFKLEETDPGLYIRRVWNNTKNYFIEKQEAADMVITLDWLRQYYPEQADEVEQFLRNTPWKYLLHPTVQLAHGKMSVDILDTQPPAEMESILVKMGAAFDLAYKRFSDLQQSEKQIREGKIELALERVRARTMAMQNSDELSEVSFLLDTQVRSLGIKTQGCAFNIYGVEESTEWFSNEVGTMPAYKTPMKDLFLRYYDAGRNGELMHIEKFEGETCVAHYEYLCTIPGMGDGLKAMIEAGGSFPVRQTDHVVYFKYGYVLFLTLEDVPEAHDIFIRFAKVFEQTYTRFLDLKKAEAQMLRAELDLVEIKAARKKAEETLVELQSAQKQLIQSEKMASLGELTAGIAHEIQNPLNFVNNFSEINREMIGEMIEEIAKGNYDAVKSIAEDIEANEEKINHHGKRAGDIVRGMLQHSRKSEGTKEPTDINALADEYLRLAYHGLRAKDKSFNAEMKTDFDTSIGTINIIPQDIGRVILNLITNAFYAVNEKKKLAMNNQQSADSFQPTVSLSTKKLNNAIEIKVGDNGNGILSSIKDKIFQPFFTTKPTGSGTGLGLSLAYDIVKAHGGEIKVERKEEAEEGTTFTIQLPL